MKYLKLFESDDNKNYIEQCFLDILENTNFKVELFDVPPTYDIRMKLGLINPRVKYEEIIVYKINIELGDNITLPSSISSNLYIGMVKTDLEFLKIKAEKISELYEDIDIALSRVKDNFPASEYQIWGNRREQIEIIIIIKK